MPRIGVSQFSKRFDEFVSIVLIPVFLADDYSKYLETHGKHGNQWRSNRREKKVSVDALIVELMNADTSERIEIILRRADPTILPFYYERLALLSDFLRQSAYAGKTLPQPDSWVETLTRLLLECGAE
jgi:hypothetical protein